MYKQKLLLLLTAVLCCRFSEVFSQVSVSPSSGCMPGGITNALFAYVGSGTPSNVLWNFGDNTTSTLTAPQHSYLSAGNYTVTFTASVLSAPVTYTSPVAVNPAPTGNFQSTIPATHCVGMTASFAGSSALSNAVYNWDYGDNNLGVGNPSSHSYGAAGNFVPILTIENPVTHCFVNVTGPAIPVSTPPNIQITANPGLATCAPIYVTTIDASNSTSGSPLPGGNLTYSWNFPTVGAFSTANTGPMTFQPAGIYPGVLTVTDNNSCSSSTVITVKLISPVVTAVVPSAVCIADQDPNGPFFAVTVTSSEPTTTWDMGDGTTLSFPLPNPPLPTPVLTPNVPYTSIIHAYTSQGMKIITITATDGPCSTTITKNIMVEKITHDFTGTVPAFTCSPYFSISFNNLTTINTASGLLYTWTVKHWDQNPAHAYTSNATNPTFLISQVSLNPYALYSPPYVASTNLFVTSVPLGCFDDITHYFDSIERPTALFKLNTNEGCAPLTASFTNISEVSAAFPITSYTWNFGASASSTLAGTGSTIPLTNFTYNNPGTYYPTLSISTASGCSHTSYAHTVTVVNPAPFTFTLPTNVCAGTDVAVNLAAPSTATIQHWHVDTDAGYFSGCVNDKDPTWRFGNIGVHDYTITAYQFGCKSTSVIPAHVTVKGPMGRFTYETNCGPTTKKAVKFYYSLHDVVSATLDFGDNTTPLNITGTPTGTVNGTHTHNYATSGDKTVTLISQNGPNACGPYTQTVVVSVRDLKADFTSDTVICKNAWLSMDASASTDVMTGCGTGYVWLVDTFPPHYSYSPLYTATNQSPGVGTFPIKLIVRDINGCSDEMTKNFRVSSPAPNFTFNANPICLSAMPAQMLNLTPQTPDPVTNYKWTMGDSVYNFSQQHSILYGASPTFSFNLGNAQTRTFSVVVEATNSYGCKNTKRHDITVNDPKIDVYAEPLHTCYPSPLNFLVWAANTHTNYTVNFGDGNPFSTNSFSTNTFYSFAHNVSAPGAFNPTVTLTDNAGCVTKSVLPTSHVELVPVSNFTFYNVLGGGVNSSTMFCLPTTLKAKSTSQYPGQLSYFWDTDNGFGPLLGPDTAGSTIKAIGVHTIALTVQTQYAGCRNTKVSSYEIFDPHINFDLVPATNSVFCIGEAITVSVTNSQGSGEWIWDFGDSKPQAPISNNVFNIGRKQTFTYDPGFFPEPDGEVRIRVTGYGSSSARHCKESDEKRVKLIRVLAAFNRGTELLRTDSLHCLFDKTDEFINKSTTNSSSTMSYTWDLGNSNASFITDASQLYVQPGTFTITLTAREDDHGCTATTAKQVTVFRLPTAQLNVRPLSCPDTPFHINGSAVPGGSVIVSGSLTPSASSSAVVFNSAGSFTMNGLASQSTTYVLNVTDDNGCKASSPSASVYVQQPAPEVHWDTTVVIGQIVPLNAYTGPGFSYTWSPTVSLNCDTCLFFNPVSHSTVNITYSVAVEDGLQCSVVKNTYRINIDPKISLDVPTAFTPNGDGINDVIFPDGWGIRKLYYFKVFNRWGQLVFESNDMKVGWNGVYQGVPQNMETYVYQVSAETYLDREPTITKSGTFKLIR